MKEKKSIILVGMSGAGKSTLGVLAAKALGMDFLDTDLLIQRREGMVLQEILARRGIDGFLRVEEEVLCGCAPQHTVVATGGSAVYSEAAMRHLAAFGPIVYLHVPYEEIARRLTNITTRGIVMRSGSTLRDVYDERLPLYRKYSNLTLPCAGGDAEENVRQLVSAVRYRA